MSGPLKWKPVPSLDLSAEQIIEPRDLKKMPPSARAECQFQGDTPEQHRAQAARFEAARQLAFREGHQVGLEKGEKAGFEAGYEAGIREATARFGPTKKSGGSNANTQQQQQQQPEA